MTGESGVDAKVAAIACDATLSESAKIDRIAEQRGWWRGSAATTATLRRYLAGDAGLGATAEALAAPIDEAYRTANHGRALARAAAAAKSQRAHQPPGQGAELWGAPEEDAAVPPPAPDADAHPTAEGGLWDLWYGVLHAAKLPPSSSHDHHDRLLTLVRALQARPDPPLPRPATKALRNDWVWRSGRLWSELALLGAAVREAANDAPGVAAGWTPPETRAWARFHAFVARLAGDGDDAPAPEFAKGAVFDVAEALEEDVRGGDGNDPPAAVKLATYLTVAAGWVRHAGGAMWREVEEAEGAKEEKKDGETEEEEVDVSLRGKKLPFYRSRDWSKTRWDFWRRRFEQEAGNQELPEDVRGLAAEAAKRMAELEGKAS
ncbi:hypothetical protein F4780DRAFT_774767 [Xylariomycetidae sp. FL0641]|nr:hypothetical protein F4780DRAFT_774767 [Xylariomycetidae sp. FL0641]